MSSVAHLKYLSTVLSFILTIVACMVHMQDNWLEKPPIVVNFFGMTFLEIGPMRSARNLPKQK
jgi:heme/copper-type cytochrome/quinol oxidase subunit 4